LSHCEKALRKLTNGFLPIGHGSKLTATAFER
jgi:hypothetical protein